MNATPLLYEVPDLVVSRPSQAVPRPVVTASEDSVTGVAGVVLFLGELLDRLGLVAEADRRCLRPIAPGGYTSSKQPRDRPASARLTKRLARLPPERRPPSQPQRTYSWRAG